MPSTPPIDPTIGHLLAAVGSVDADRATVLSVLAAVADPRARRGIRHGLSTILTVAVCAVLAGARSFVAITEWVADLDPETRA
jgi:DDE_Tnp_1-associated